MVAMGGALDARMTAQGARRSGVPARAASASRLSVAVVTLIASVGVLVSSSAYAAARSGYSDSAWANRAYWLGQALVLIPISIRLISRRRLTSGETVTLIVVLSVAQYILKVCYSPIGFTFNDELLHWSGVTNVLATGNPYAQNYGLPIGSHYPGLEEVTSALMSATGISIFPAGLIVAGVAHLLFTCALYWTFGTFTRSQRIAGVAVLIYYGTPALTSFNSMFVYETLALGLLGVVAMAAVQTAGARSRSRWARWFILAVLAIISVTVTHHITSYMMAGFLLLLTVATLITGARSAALKLGTLTAVAVVSIAGWIAFFARDTITYFAPTAQGMIQGLSALQNQGSSTAPPTTLAPFGNQALQAIGLLIVTVLLLIGSWQVWRRYRTNAWFVAMTIGALGWFGALAIRVGDPDGQELAGRSATFVYIPVVLIAALALAKLFNTRLLSRMELLGTMVATAAVVAFLFDGLANGWPPYWERLPGPHQAAGNERSIGPEEIALADWFRDHSPTTLAGTCGKTPDPACRQVWELTGTGNRIAVDSGTYPLLFSYANQNPLQVVSYLYDTTAWTPAVAQEAAGQDVHYVVTDSRLTKSLPLAGSYFPGDDEFATKTLAPAALSKFNDVPGISRVFDDGDIVVYNLQSLGYVPQKP